MISGADASKILEAPTGISAFVKETEMVPRSWAEDKANVIFWQEHERGGHFPAYEKPEEFANDLLRFFPTVWKPSNQNDLLSDGFPPLLFICLNLSSEAASCHETVFETELQ